MECNEWMGLGQMPPSDTDRPTIVPSVVAMQCRCASGCFPQHGGAPKGEAALVEVEDLRTGIAGWEIPRGCKGEGIRCITYNFSGVIIAVNNPLRMPVPSALTRQVLELSN